MQNYYSLNRLSLNSDKTNLLVIRPLKWSIENVNFSCNGFVIKEKNTIKILGSLFNRSATCEADISHTVSSCMSTLHKLRPLIKWTSLETRRVLVKALVLSKLEYLAFTYVSATEAQLNRLHKVLMTSARLIFGSYGFKVSCDKILKTTQLLTLRRICRTEAVKFINGVMHNRKPLLIYSLINMPNRLTAPIYPKYLPRASKFRNFYFYKMLKYFNELPLTYRNISVKKFKRQLKSDAMNGRIVSCV